ncbi:hypothetical protein HNP99_000349 [Flavobacterium sp. 28A]|uniref:hypothetical protein n=1 Tax=Flavobacterium sp. 28A TaxID=2735895 RepID=UPI001D5F3AF8|nr:hypothetical protein [Flavobacterium sp. 28A]NRT14024.1 hypothetical protein [Flavobacterium sp. 28A]
MNKTTFYKSLITSLFLFFLFFANLTVAQVGIGTVTPDATAVLDVSSTTKGMLTPRMTTTQRNAITTPANGLMVYDTTLKSFYYYEATTSLWLPMNSVAGASDRLNFKRIKSTDVLATVLAAEKTAGLGGKYLLNTNTLYEINGTINLDLPIDLNDAYVIGLDTNEDKLVKAMGALFTGKGGSIKGLTLQATVGAVFTLTGGSTESLIFRDCVVVNSQSIGTISGFGLVFSSIVQYAGNAAGVTYTNISKLLLSNIGWFGTNSGTYEKLIGTFGLVQKQSGFTEVNGSAIGFDVSSNPIISGDAVMEAVVFTGSNIAGFVKAYTGTGTYSGYNFTNKWTINCPGITLEGDRFATGTLYLDRSTTAQNNVSNLAVGTAVRLNGTTISSRLFRMADGDPTSENNKLVYKGRAKRVFTVSASISMQASGTTGTQDYLFSFVKFSGGSGSFISDSDTFIDSNSGFVQSFSVTGTVELSDGDYVSLYVRKASGNTANGGVITFNSYNMSLR